MMTDSSNNMLIAKNTLFLCLRMFFIMLVNLYTSRVILQVLGAEDYGIYSVVGGVVTMMTVITGSLSSAITRFLTFELGKKDGDAERMFRCVATIIYILTIVFFAIAETVGLWFVLSELSVPAERENAVFWVYQFSVCTFVISFLSVPYNGLIIAKERMNAFAYISIYEGLARLSVVLLLYIIPFDHLIVYAALLALVQLSVRLLYTGFCVKNFSESNGRWLWDYRVSKRILSFAGFSTLGSISVSGYTQGISILLNLYFGPMINAAHSIASQVQMLLIQFFYNFQTAIRPQVIKNYAQGNIPLMQSLVLRAGRLSLLIAIFVCVPLFTFSEYILKWWLVTPPEHVIAFVRLLLLVGISNSLSQHILMAIHATGDIKKFQVVECCCLLSILPISWFLLRFYSVMPEVVLCVYLSVEMFTQFVRVAMVYPKIGLDIRLYFTKVLVRPLLASSAGVFLAYYMCNYTYPDSFMSLGCQVVLLMVVEGTAIFYLGLESVERRAIVSRINFYAGEMMSSLHRHSI